MTPAEFSLELEDVELKRGDRVLVSELSFRLEAGQLALLTGPNGSGKTTLLRTIAGFTPANAGEIRLAGVSVRKLEPEQRGLLAYQGHLEGLKKDLTAYENILFISSLLSNIDVLDEVITELNLTPILHRSVRQLSAGQKRRVALACLRLSRARLWLLDEPLTNLDQAGRSLITAWLDRHLENNGCAVVATHRAADLTRPGTTLVEL